MLTTTNRQSLVAKFLEGGVDASLLPEPNWGPIGKAVYERTYRRDNEAWADTVKRVVIGNLGFAPESSALEGEAEELFRLIYNFKAVPAGRHLWTTGTVASRLNRNCWVAGWSKKLGSHYRFSASRLFEGGGVGSNYSHDLLAQTALITKHLDILITCRADHSDYELVKSSAGDLFVEANELPDGYEVETVVDMREGWVDTWVDVIERSTQDGSSPVVIDVSDLRPYGSPLKTFGGRASGPAPLAQSLEKIIELLNTVAREGRQISGVEAMLLDHYIAESIVAGGARRSARMSLMHWSDPGIFEFIDCKLDPMQHWTTNISVEVDSSFVEAVEDGDAHANAILDRVISGMIQSGEPGFVNSELHSIGEYGPIRMVNPCGEASLYADTNADGDAAGESCNLGSVNLAAFGHDVDGATRAFELMARFLYRATLNPHIDPSASRIERANRRIGVGFFGLQGWTAEHGVRLSELPQSTLLVGRLNEYRQACRTAADALADELGTPRPVKVTAVAPTGTIAQMSGDTPGVHPVFAKHFVRRVRFADSDPGLAAVLAEGHTAVPDLYAANTTVVEYLLRDAILDRYSEALIEDVSELSIEDYINLVACIQQSFCGGADGQAVSATATIPVDISSDRLRDAVLNGLPRLKGLTVFPEVSRPLSPYERLTEAEYLARVELEGNSVGDSNDGSCIGGACPVR
jgi:adenosylcobalamin-dependent ribonucleoside-triphosphate reductase